MSTTQDFVNKIRNKEIELHPLSLLSIQSPYSPMFLIIIMIHKY